MHSIHVDSRRKYDKTLRKLYLDARLLDMTSKADEPWIKLILNGEYPLKDDNSK